MHCQMCGGLLTFLGQLGSLLHYRCENCGMDSSVRDTSNDETPQDWDGLEDPDEDQEEEEDDDYDPVEEEEREAAREDAYNAMADEQ